MGLKLKDGINPETLREFGFKLGKEWADAGERCLAGGGYDYQHGWYHKFSMDPDNPDKILYADEEYDQPMVHLSVRTEGKYHNDIYIDCTPSCTYHIGGSEMDLVSDTLYDLVQAGILERYGNEE